MVTRQTIKECNEIIRSQAERIAELEDKLARGQQHAYQQIGVINNLKADVMGRDDRLFESKKIIDRQQSTLNAQRTWLEEKDNAIAQLNTAVEGLNKLCTERCEVIAKQSITIADREGEIEDLVSVNQLLRKHLDEGVVLAEGTVDLLTKYKPCIHAFNELVHLVQRDNRNLHAVLDDAEFLDALYPLGGQNIRTLVRFILGLVP